MRLFGVKIIDKIVEELKDEEIEENLKSKLFQIAPLLALVSIEKNRSRNDWESEFERIKDKLSSIYFYRTTEICLSYGDNDDKQKRSSWTKENNFYFVGDWKSLRIIDGLVEPLGKFLNIRNSERLLTVLLSETFAEGIEYLKEKDYDVSMIPIPEMEEDQLEGGTTQATDDYLKQIGKEGEKFVFNKLRDFYSNKYEKEIYETERGFKINGSVEVIWQNKERESYLNHDFKISEKNKTTYIDSKATTYLTNQEKVALYISNNEWNLMEQSENYFIARVFNVFDNPEMTLIKLKVDDL